MPDINLISIILIFPLISFLVCPFLGKKNKNLAGIIFILVTLAALISSIFLRQNNQEIQQKVLSFSWFSIAGKPFNISFLLDHYSLNMLVLVNFISIMVGLFSIKYMEKEKAIGRYFGFIGLFLLAMQGVVISGNFFQLYIFWELVGFSSYLLIGFWYTKNEAILAAKKAFLMNRVGDLAFLLGLFMLFYYTGNTNINGLKLETNSTAINTIIGLLFFGGCLAKSAQFPLHSWLPDAMEGPTPVSALIHAATMVAAGIYLIIRAFPIFTPTVLVVMTIIGTLTMLMGGIKAIFQTDIKKVLAYSTISQLGLMVLAVGGGAPQLAFNHLQTHAFFKAGLFLAAGAVIYSMHKAKPEADAQNMLSMGAFRKKMPLTFIAYLACTGAMIGLPFFSGFVTKDQIIELWQHSSQASSLIIFICLLVSAILSALYMGRQIWLIFLRPSQLTENEYNNLNESSLLLLLPVLILALLSTYIILPIIGIDIPSINFTAVLSTLMAILGLLLIYFQKEKWVNLKYNSVINQFYDQVVGLKTLSLANFIANIEVKIIDGFTVLVTQIVLTFSKIIDWVDRFMIDGLVVFLQKCTQFLGRRFNNLQNGQVQWYFSAIAILVFLIFILL